MQPGSKAVLASVLGMAAIAGVGATLGVEGCGGNSQVAATRGAGGSGQGGGDAGGKGDAAAGDAAAGDAADGSSTMVLHPNAAPLPGEAACEVTIVTHIAIPSRQHVPVCTHVAYATNPPSGGDHWPVWAAFKKYDRAVLREMYVHDLEHGAVVLAYRCDKPCPDVVNALGVAFAGKTPDPKCEANIGGPPARLVVTPDPQLAKPIGLAAWGATYTATCIDPPSLAAFVESAYGHAPEDECADGIDIEADASVLAACPDGGSAE